MLFARRNRKKFWIGLNPWYVQKENAPVWDAEDGWWLVHFHHNSVRPSGWLQQLSSSGKNELKRLLVDVHEVMASEVAISDIAWHKGRYEEATASGFPLG